MAFKKSQWVCLSLVFLYALGAINAQSILSDFQGNSSGNDTIEEVITAIPLTSINSASTQAFSRFNQAAEVKLGSNERNIFSARTDSITRRVQTYLSDTAGMDFENLNFREIEKFGNMMLLFQGDIKNIQEMINVRLVTIQDENQKLKESRKLWNLTLKENDSLNTPDAINKRINHVINNNDSIRQILVKDIDFLLTQSDRVTSLQISLDRFKNDLVNYGAISSSKIFQRDMPPIWGASTAGDSISIANQWQGFKSKFGNDSIILARKYGGRILLSVFLFIFLFALVFWLRATIKDLNIKEKTVFLSLYVNEILLKPVEVSLLVGLYIVWLVMPEMPESYNSIIAIVSVYAIIRIAIEILPHGYRRFLIGFAIAYVLIRFYELFYNQYIPSRIILLSSQVVAIIYLVHFVKIRRRVYAKKQNAFNRMLSFLSGLYLVFLVVALAGNIAGTMSFSEFLTSGIINSGFLIFATYVGFHLVAALVYLVLSSSLFSKSNIIQKQSGYIFNKIYGIIRFVFVLSWIYIALDQFNIRESVFDWGKGFLTGELSIGQASFKLINVVLFLFVIWLSLIISKFVRHILQEEVFPRVEVERGMPGTINLLVRLTLVIIGFILAANVAGMEMSSLTIIIGAFSVGIGFGLQNIFNNLVSGLILIFERPIKEGDTVEVNALLGVVKKIGIRSSVIRTYDGAEVIVPNGSLISNDLINWTLSDATRRADIRVGVAYGTDPNSVLQLLQEVAKANQYVIQDPAPRALFLGFGDSSLDFRLLAWADLENRLEMESELKVAINAGLKEAGIEIPFPQRDLHVRSVDLFQPGAQGPGTS